MPRARTNDIEIEYETHGDPSGRPLLLLRGLGTQMIQWDPRFREMLTAAGHWLILFDNRDVGLSTHFSAAGKPNIGAILEARQNGAPIDAAYTLSDMANDVFGLMDVLGVETAHLAGISMGGMIVQQAAIQQPERVRSLISIMSSTGEPGLPGPTPQAAAALSSPPPGERSAYIEHSLKNQLVIGSPGFALDEDAYREMAGRVFDRAFDPDGIARQMAAVTATGSRKEALAALTLPALVIHGDSDPLIPLAGGEATANAIPGAKLCVVPGMGHNVPEGAWPTICDAIAQHTRLAED